MIMCSSSSINVISLNIAFSNVIIRSFPPLFDCFQNQSQFDIFSIIFQFICYQKKICLVFIKFDIFLKTTLKNVIIIL